MQKCAPSALLIYNSSSSSELCHQVFSHCHNSRSEPETAKRPLEKVTFIIEKEANLKTFIHPANPTLQGDQSGSAHAVTVRVANPILLGKEPESLSLYKRQWQCLGRTRP